jgi:hypothetical protein
MMFGRTPNVATLAAVAMVMSLASPHATTHGWRQRFAPAYEGEPRRRRHDQRRNRAARHARRVAAR